MKLQWYLSFFCDVVLYRSHELLLVIVERDQECPLEALVKLNERIRITTDRLDCFDNVRAIRVKHENIAQVAAS